MVNSFISFRGGVCGPVFPILNIDRRGRPGVLLNTLSATHNVCYSLAGICAMAPRAGHRWGSLPTSAHDEVTCHFYFGFSNLVGSRLAHPCPTQVNGSRPVSTKATPRYTKSPETKGGSLQKTGLCLEHIKYFACSLLTHKDLFLCYPSKNAVR